jgi:hypothetical protein
VGKLLRLPHTPKAEEYLNPSGFHRSPLFGCAANRHTYSGHFSQCIKLGASLYRRWQPASSVLAKIGPPGTLVTGVFERWREYGLAIDQCNSSLRTVQGYHNQAKEQLLARQRRNGIGLA